MLPSVWIRRVGSISWFDLWCCYLMPSQGDGILMFCRRAFLLWVDSYFATARNRRVSRRDELYLWKVATFGGTWSSSSVVAYHVVAQLSCNAFLLLEKCIADCQCQGFSEVGGTGRGRAEVSGLVELGGGPSSRARGCPPGGRPGLPDQFSLDLRLDYSRT